MNARKFTTASITAPLKRSRDRSGETIGGWLLLERVDGGDGGESSYRARHHCGFERVLPLTYLRECERRGTTGCASCYVKPSKDGGCRAIKPGAVYGTWRVVSIEADGPNKFKRKWLCECIRCGSRSVICEHVLPSHRTQGTQSCRSCQGKRDITPPQTDKTFVCWEERDGKIDVGIHTADGRLFLGTLRAVTA